MLKFGQSSFRRVLLSRLLLLTIPVLVTGEYVAYRKARDNLLETARQNLTESAVRKGETIQDLMEATRSTLVAASAAVPADQSNEPETATEFVQRLLQVLPAGGRCVQLTNLQANQITATTCPSQPIDRPALTDWASQQQELVNPRANVWVLPAQRSGIDRRANARNSLRQLDLVFSSPIYDRAGQLQSALSLELGLHQQEISRPGSLSGYSVVIDQDGTILAHPNSARIGRNIRQEANAAVLQEIVTSAIAGKQDFLRLFSLDGDSDEWLAGYSPIRVVISPTEKRTWVVLAVAPVENALSGLDDIKQVLMILTIGLLLANLLATIYLAREMARPIEQLGDYALHIDQRHAERAPKNFKIRELNQLAVALDQMVERLEERAEELEAAWQEAQIANQLKSEFLATTSHELRTPLNGIIGCVRLVRDGCCDGRDEELEFLQQADEAAIHLLKIINDLLDIAKIEAGKIELNLQPVCIQELCQQCLKMVQPGAEKKRLSLTIAIDDQIQQMPLDQRRVHQMIINLLSNAVKFTPEGGQVKLSAWMGYGAQLEQEVRPDRSPVNSDTPYLCLEVQDSGIGIPQDRWHLLFRPFQQVDSSLTRKHEGTGLGLAFTKRLAELHGGTVSFQSTPGKGSIFRIWLPSQDIATAIASELPLPTAQLEPDRPGEIADVLDRSLSAPS